MKTELPPRAHPALAHRDPPAHGLLGSATLLSRLAVPVLYFLVARRGRAAMLQREGALAAGPPQPGGGSPANVHALVARPASQQ